MINILYDIPWVDGKFVTQYMVLLLPALLCFPCKKMVLFFSLSVIKIRDTDTVQWESHVNCLEHVSLQNILG